MFFFEVEVLGDLGIGGQGSVFLVIDPDTKEKYALKQISMLQGGGGENEMAVLLKYEKTFDYVLCFMFK
jgi:hypothetical protein